MEKGKEIKRMGLFVVADISTYGHMSDEGKKELKAIRTSISDTAVGYGAYTPFGWAVEDEETGARLLAYFEQVRTALENLQATEAVKILFISEMIEIPLTERVSRVLQESARFTLMELKSYLDADNLVRFDSRYKRIRHMQGLVAPPMRTVLEGALYAGAEARKELRQERNPTMLLDRMADKIEELGK